MRQPASRIWDPSCQVVWCKISRVTCARPADSNKAGFQFKFCLIEINDGGNDGYQADSCGNSRLDRASQSISSARSAFSLSALLPEGDRVSGATRRRWFDGSTTDRSWW